MANQSELVTVDEDILVHLAYGVATTKELFSVWMCQEVSEVILCILGRDFDRSFSSRS